VCVRRQLLPVLSAEWLVTKPFLENYFSINKKITKTDFVKEW